MSNISTAAAATTTTTATATTDTNMAIASMADVIYIQGIITTGAGNPQVRAFLLNFLVISRTSKHVAVHLVLLILRLLHGGLTSGDLLHFFCRAFEFCLRC